MDQFANAAAAIQASVDQNNAWSAQQAQKQMDFQREMSNTAFQRQVADLKAAGLNPVLSAKLGGASTPSGAMASGDTSGTSALVDLLHLAMQTANSAANAAATSSGSTSGLLDSGSDNSAYHMSKDDAAKIHDWLGDGSKQEEAYNAVAGTIGSFFGKFLGKKAGEAIEKGIIDASPEFDPVKRGEATVDRYNSNAVGTKWLVENMSKVVDGIYNSAKNKIAAFNSVINKNSLVGHSHTTGKF